MTMVRSNLLRLAILSFLALSQLLSLIAEDKLGQAVELYQSRKYSEAEAALREVLGEDPGNSRAHHTLGLVLMELKNYGDAASEFQKAVEAGPATDAMQVDLARACVELKDWDKAEAALRAAKEINSENPEIYYLRGRVAAGRKDYASAAADFEKAIELNPGHAYAHYYVGIAYNELKRRDKTVQHFNIFLKLAPDAPEAKKVESLLRALR
jgi:tetratricopeptide (TPR) repeat protein